MALRWNDDARTLSVGIRSLGELQRRSIDRRPGAGLAMSSEARLAHGRGLHTAIQSARAEEGWASEVTLRWTGVVREWTVTVTGRVDGVSEEDGHTVVEELKSTALDNDALDACAGFPEWEEQVRLYLWLAVQARMDDPIGRLRVVSLLDGGQRLFHVPPDPALDERLRARLDRLVREREAMLHWNAVRRDTPPRFGHTALRPGQAEIVRAAEDAVEEGGHLLLTAPTGIGKTAAVLHGVLTAAARRGASIYWATARTTQQAAIEVAVRAAAAAGTPIRAVTLRARAKSCIQDPPLDCRPEACPYADGFRDRVGAPGVLDALTTEPLPGPARIESVARAATVCPHELSVEHALVCDLVIGDYNQCFDPDFQLKRLFAEREWILVVDEAHQLPDRAMEHGSPALPLALAEAAVTATAEAGLDALHALAVEIRDEIAEAGLREDWADGVEALSGDGDAPAVPELPVELPRRRWLDLRARIDEIALDHARLRPGGDEHEDPWMSLARAVLRFSEALQRAGEETVCLWTPPTVPGADVPASAQPGLRLVCRDPHRILGPRFDEARASVLMSATLAPAWLLRERCGLAPDRARELYVPSPFPPENRRVVAVPGVSTAWKDREKHGAKIAAAIDKTIEAIPGNVAVYVASYERMRDLLTRATFAGRPLLYQGPDTSDADRAALLAALVEPGPPRVLVAVLGGALSEGVDLPDQALAAAIIVGPALPPPSLERAMRVAWYEERYGGDGTTGFDLAYVQPGMTKAVQAAGRVVRGPEDRGLVVLLCQRFLRHEYAAYLPTEWTVEKSGKPWEVAAEFFGDGA